MEECSSAGGQCHHAVAKSERAVFLVSNALGRLSKDCAQRENEGVRGRRVSCMCRRSYVAYLLAVANSSLSPQLKNMESPLSRLGRGGRQVIINKSCACRTLPSRVLIKYGIVPRAIPRAQCGSRLNYCLVPVLWFLLFLLARTPLRTTQAPAFFGSSRTKAKRRTG
jgi:hypothetical protein